MTGEQKKPLVIVGTGGHARVILSLVKSLHQWDIVGLLDRDPAPQDELIGGYKIIGSWRDLTAIREQGVRHAVIAVGDNGERRQLYQSLLSAHYDIPTVIHPTAYIDSSATIEEGCAICMGALIGAHVTIGSNTVINSGSIVDHECQIESHVHIAPGCRIAGRVRVGAETFIGIGASIIDKVKIGRRVTIGAGSVVISDLLNDVVVCGVPARVIKGNPP